MSLDPAKVHTVIDEMVMDGADDWVDLANAVGFAVEYAGAVTDLEARALVLAAIRAVLEQELMQVGDIDWDSGVFVPWQGSTAQLVARVDQEWRQLGRDPEMWEVCWLANTEAGTRRGEQLLAARGEQPA